MKVIRLLTLLLVATTMGCGGSKSQGKKHTVHYGMRKGPKATKKPKWVSEIKVQSNKLCGFGVAGAGLNEHSPWPKKLSEERAVENLAGVIHTHIQEAIIDEMNDTRTKVELARSLTVDEGLIEQVAGMVKTEFWLDVKGKGPYVSKGFIYANACIDASVAAANLKIDKKYLKKGKKKRRRVSPKHVPWWIKRDGKQKGGRLCAVGFSLPMFHPDKTFQAVVEDIRTQLAMVLQTFVSSYYEELATNRGAAYEAMTMATTDMVSKGAVVTHYWYDRDGKGPNKKTRSTYGWGCVYPVDVLLRSVEVVQEEIPEDEKDAIARVKENAAASFAELEAMEEKRNKGP